MKFFLIIGNILGVLILGFLWVAIIPTSAIADNQTLGISAISGDIQIVEDLKSLDKNQEYLKFVSQTGIPDPGLFHPEKYTKPLPEPALTQRRIMLNTAYSEPVACLQA